MIRDGSRGSAPRIDPRKTSSTAQTKYRLWRQFPKQHRNGLLDAKSRCQLQITTLPNITIHKTRFRVERLYGARIAISERSVQKPAHPELICCLIRGWSELSPPTAGR